MPLNRKIGIRISQDQETKILEFSKSCGIKKSQFVRDWIDSFLDNYFQDETIIYKPNNLNK